MFLNKVNIYQVEQTNTDNDPDYAFTVWSSPKFAQALSSDYNITTSSISFTSTSFTATGAAAASYTYGSALTQNNCAAPATPYKSIVAYLSDISTEIYVQEGKNSTVVVTKPCLVPPHTAVLNFVLSGSYTWTSYNSATRTLSFTAPSNPSGQLTTYLESLTETTSDGKKVFLQFKINVFSCTVSNCATCTYAARNI